MRILEMWGVERNYLIKNHKFYLEQGVSKLMSQFENIEEEADKFANDWLENNEYPFDPDYDDPADIYEKANDIGLEYGLNLYELQDHTRLSILSGLYHKWEKDLRVWLTRESRFWKCRESFKLELWKPGNSRIFSFFKGLGWDIKQEDFYQDLEAIRLIVNVYKHGNGNSFNDLKKEYPKYIRDFDPNSPTSSIPDYYDHEDLIISDRDLIELASAIEKFWNKLPSTFDFNNFKNVPQWLRDSYKVDDSKFCASQFNKLIVMSYF
ncbi:hypothetical protein [Acinetobacter pittii]|uniref:hypothetical protein n=1 Tax=Acinetobacter pittii TaxID=48296 RepID=UPI001D090E70|nr:hypothetical protein [Acinetobacter pittii]